MTTRAPLIAVVGPTASGKSDLALEIAEHAGGELVNCDSLQLYRYMDIGTAKTPVHERRGIPHHLIDILDPDQVSTAGEYARLARPVLKDIAARGRIPVVAGGTGFYLQALLDGLFPGPPADPALRARLARHPARLHALLKKIDKKAAARIHPNDIKKLIRAIEVCFLARKPISELQPDRLPLAGFDVLRIGLDPPREALYARIDERCKMMFSRGILEETHFVVEHFGNDAKALEAIGYAQAVKVLSGSLSPEDAVACTQLETRRYAKRQMTWFRRKGSTNWLLNFGNQAETMNSAIRLVDDHIKKIFPTSERKDS